MRLLDTCQSDAAARFAIQSLRKDFPEVLRSRSTPGVAGQARAAAARQRPRVPRRDAAGLPEFHQGKLRGLGLHEAVLALLASAQPQGPHLRHRVRPRARAGPARRAARGLVAGERPLGHRGLRRRGAGEAQPARARRGLPRRGCSCTSTRRVRREGARAVASTAPTCPRRSSWTCSTASNEQRDWAKGTSMPSTPPPSCPPPSIRSCSLTAHSRTTASQPRGADSLKAAQGRHARRHRRRLAAGQRHPPAPRRHGAEAGSARRRAAGPGRGAGEGARLQREVPRGGPGAAGQPQALLRAPVTVPWLLALARRADPALHEFAHRYLLENLVARGLQRVRGRDRGPGAPLRAGARRRSSPRRVRTVRADVPALPPPRHRPRAARVQVLPAQAKAPRKAYTPERLWPALFDARDDVRRFALAVARAELRAWGYHLRVYELAEADSKEVRNLAYDALLDARRGGRGRALHAQARGAGPGEGVHAHRERQAQHARGGGGADPPALRAAGRRRSGSAWLMESADREVGLFAVRLLWEKHRPPTCPRAGSPRAPPRPPPWAATERFANVDALRTFLAPHALRPAAGPLQGGPRGHGPAALSASTAKRRNH